VSNIKRILSALGIEQQDVADALGISPAHFSRLINGRRRWPLELAARTVEYINQRSRRAYTIDEVFLCDPVTTASTSEASAS